MTDKDVGDLAAVGAAAGAWASFLPDIAAVFAIIWTGIRIYDWVQGKLAARRASPPTD